LREELRPRHSLSICCSRVILRLPTHWVLFCLQYALPCLWPCVEVGWVGAH